MFELTVNDEIASAHFLRGYEGKCRNLHGHTWKIEITLRAEVLNELGMAEDFAVLKRKLSGFLKQLDHVNLNELDYFKAVNPTAENIAKFIYKGFMADAAPLRVVKVQVWESRKASAVYYE